MDRLQERHSIIKTDLIEDEVNRLTEENKQLRKLLFEQFEVNGKSIQELSKSNFKQLKRIQEAEFLMKKVVTDIKQSSVINICKSSFEIELFLNKYYFNCGQEINDECNSCNRFGECKGMLGGNPCPSYENKIGSVGIRDRIKDFFNK